MTEIQFLLEIVLHCKSLKQVKEKCLTRIGEVEAMLVKPPAQMPRPMLPQSAQAPSTQRLMEEHVTPSRVTTPPLPGKIDRETGSVMVPTGEGTYGKRKF